VPGFISDSPLARELIRIGDEAIASEDDAKLRVYFRDDYVFHGPGGDLRFAELSAYFASLRVGFSNLRIVREQITDAGDATPSPSDDGNPSPDAPPQLQPYSATALGRARHPTSWDG